MQTSAAHAVQWEIQPGPAGGGVYSSAGKDAMKNGVDLYILCFLHLCHIWGKWEGGGASGMDGIFILKSCYSKDLSEVFFRTTLYFCSGWVNRNTST